MNNQQRKNLGLTWPVISIAAIILFVVIWSFFDISTSFGRAPLVNKIVSILLGAGAILWMYGASRDLFFNGTKNDNRVLWYNIIIVLALGILSLLFAGVFHSGALGTTTNPI
jgi:hypothetical protein